MAARPVDNIFCGTASWTDKTLIDSKAFYPSGATSAKDRLEYYAEHFPMVEVDSTYYALPAERNAVLWVERTPAEFVFNIKAFGWFTRHSISAKRLPNEIKYLLPDELKGKHNLTPKDVPERAGEMIWTMFEAALRPLERAGKLGAVLLQFPHWFSKNKENVSYLRELVERLPFHAAVEFRGGGWMDEGRQDSTLQILEEIGATYVVVDEPQGFKSSVPPIVATTSNDLSMLRFHGHNGDNWERKGLTPAERFRYLYEDSELEQWIPAARELAGNSKQLHVVFNNCYADYGVRNAQQMANMLAT